MAPSLVKDRRDKNRTACWIGHSSNLPSVFHKHKRRLEAIGKVRLKIASGYGPTEVSCWHVLAERWEARRRVDPTSEAAMDRMPLAAPAPKRLRCAPSNDSRPMRNPPPCTTA